MNRNVWSVIASQGLLAGALLLPAGGARAATLLAWAATQAVVLVELLRPRSRLLVPNLWRCRPQPRVGLTFDDGPHPIDTPAILEVLRARDVRATFFFVGDRASRHPDLVRLVALAGHEIGVHSQTHPWWFSLAGPARVRREVVDAADTIERIGQRRPRWFRSPMGHKNLFLRDVLPKAGLRLATWSSRSYDTLGRPPAKIVDALVGGVAPGGIILLHEGVRRDRGQVSTTVAALPEILDGLRARGLAPVTLQDLERAPEGPVSRTPAHASVDPARGARASSPPRA